MFLQDGATFWIFKFGGFVSNTAVWSEGIEAQVLHACLILIENLMPTSL